MVDRIAKFAPMNPQAVGTCEQWHHWLTDPSLLNAMQWIWYLETMRSGAPTAAPLHGLFLEHSVRALVPAEEPSAVPTVQDPEIHGFKINMKIATANVLTLSVDATTRGTSISRQQILMRQFNSFMKLVVMPLAFKKHDIATYKM